MTRSDFSTRVAIHEAAHAAANFLLGNPIHSVEISETEGTCFAAPSDDSFNRIRVLLAPNTYDAALGLQPSGYSGADSDENKVTGILRRNVATANIAEARAIMDQATEKLACTWHFSHLVRALSPVLLRERRLHGDRAEAILREADAFARSISEKTTRHGLEAHARSGEPPIDPWYEVSVGGRLVHRGASRIEAQAVHSRTPRSMFVGSVFGR